MSLALISPEQDLLFLGISGQFFLPYSDPAMLVRLPITASFPPPPKPQKWAWDPGQAIAALPFPVQQ